MFITTQVTHLFVIGLVPLFALPQFPFHIGSIQQQYTNSTTTVQQQYNNSTLTCATTVQQQYTNSTPTVHQHVHTFSFLTCSITSLGSFISTVLIIPSACSLSFSQSLNSFCAFKNSCHFVCTSRRRTLKSSTHLHTLAQRSPISSSCDSMAAYATNEWVNRYNLYC